MLTWSGLSNDAALRSNVASSKFQFGDAICQMSLLKSCRYFVVPGLAAIGGQVILVPPLELSGWRQGHLAGAGCRSDSRSRTPWL